MLAEVPRVKPAVGVQSLLCLVSHVEVAHEHVAAPEADLAVPLLVWVVKLRLAPLDLLPAAAGRFIHMKPNVPTLAWTFRRSTSSERVAKTYKFVHLQFANFLQRDFMVSQYHGGHVSITDM